MADDLLALSFLQPWLWLMLQGHKDTENRQQKPYRTAIGRRIAMHSSRGWDEDGVELARRLVPGLDPSRMRDAARGAIVGTALLAGAVEVDPVGAVGYRARQVVGDLSEQQVQQVLRSPWTFGRWGLVFVERRELAEPVPCKGALGFWRVPADVAARVRELEVTR